MRINFKFLNCIFIFYFFLISFAYLWTGQHLFPLNIVPHMDVPFGDAEALIVIKDCPFSLQELYTGQGACDPYNRPFNYPPIIYFLSKNLSFIPYKYYFFLNILIYGFTLNIFLKKIESDLIKKNNSLITSLLFFTSLFNYPLILCIERGNYEFFIITLILLAFSLIFNKKNEVSSKFFLSKFILFLASLLKIYPIFILLTLNFFRLEIAKSLNLIKLLKNIFTPIILLYLSIGSSHTYLFKNTPKTEGGLGFGFLAYYQSDFGNFSNLLLFLKIIFLFTFSIFFWKILKKQNSQCFKFEDESINSFIALSTGFILNYFLIRSYDYRLAAFTPISIYLFFIFNCNSLKIIDEFTKSLLNKLFLSIHTLIFFEGYFSIGAWPPSTMNKFAAILRLSSDFIFQPIYVSLLLACILLFIKEKQFFAPRSLNFKS